MLTGSNVLNFMFNSFLSKIPRWGFLNNFLLPRQSYLTPIRTAYLP